MFLNIHSLMQEYGISFPHPYLMSILIILACHTTQYVLLSFDPLGNKEAINVLHKTSHVISYNDIHMQNATWS